jgi:uncharacterized iron-regulated membrane protein
MKRFRQLIFWCHLVTGTLAGLVVLIMSVTGVLLAYQRQITNWADTRSYKIAPPANAEAPLTVEKLLARLRESERNAPATLTLYADAEAPASAGFTGGRTLFLNPYTGEILGEGAQGVRSFFRTVTDWHRWLGASVENRQAARAVTGACNLGFLFLVASGFYLWWPRKLTGTYLRNVLWFRRGLAARARDFNWHNVIGFWSAAPLFLVVLSGVVISYTWAGNLVYRVAGEAPPAARTAPPPQANETIARADAQSSAAALAGLDLLWTRAESQVEGWRSISVQLPAKADAPVQFTIDRGNGGQPQKRAQLTLSRPEGEVVRWEPFESYTPGRRLRTFFRFAHTGEMGGIVGQTIAGAVSLGGAFLVFTGLLLAWRRLTSWRARRFRNASTA